MPYYGNVGEPGRLEAVFGGESSDREYTREEMREACLNNYNAGMMRAMEIVLKCPDETPPVEVFRAIQAEFNAHDRRRPTGACSHT